MHPDAHKELINAIIDSELDALKVIDSATALAPMLAKSLVKVARRVVSLRATKKISVTEARKLYLEAYIAITLVGTARVAQDILDHAHPSTARILKAAKALGPEVAKVGAIRKADKMQREMERQGAQADGAITRGA